MTKPTQEQIDYWNNELAKSGFKDIEDKASMCKHHRPHWSLTGEQEQQITRSLYDTDTAEYWRTVGRAAAEMDPGNSLYSIVNAFADTGSFTEAARECDMTYNEAAKKIRKWLDSQGINSRPGRPRKWRKAK